MYTTTLTQSGVSSAARATSSPSEIWRSGSKSTRVIIRLKRARNSLLNVSKLPPEVLGDIFQRSVTLKDDFGELEEGSWNFLFVCHHWFKVALHTPEVWSFWGNTPTGWARWHRYSGTAPLDLVLDDDDYDGSTFDITLCNALRDHAARDATRRVHLWSEDVVVLNSIISPLTSAGKGVRHNSVESFVLSNNDNTPVDVSDFFTHYRFPKLQRLILHNCSITSWDLLTSRTTVLTSLTLRLSHPSPTPTTSQLFSILASNPSLQALSLLEYAVPTDSGAESSYRVSLHHLKELELVGGSRHVIGLLHQLDHPGNVNLDITLYNRTVADTPRMVGLYLRDYLQHRDKSPNGLGLSVSRSKRRITLRVGDMGRIDPSTPVWRRIVPFISIALALDQTLLEKVFLDLVPYTPQDEVVYLCSWDEPATMEDMSTRFPKFRALHSCSIPLHTVFPGSALDGDGEISTSLQHIFLEQPVVVGGNWSPLTTLLARRASSGNRLESLRLELSPHMCLEAEEHIKSMVREFKITRANLS